jgi:hypothetical protein
MLDPDDDRPVGNNISPALLRRLVQNDLADLAVILRYRGVRTLATLSRCDMPERAVVLSKARQLWDLLGFFPSSLKIAIHQLFDADGLPVGEFTASSASRMPLEPGIVGARNNAAGSSDTANAAVPQLAEAAAANPDIPALPLIRELPSPLDDDTKLVKSVTVTLQNVREFVGERRYYECIQHLLLSDEAAALSALEAAEALAALRVPKEDLRNKPVEKELLKAAKKDVRDFCLWRSCGKVGGLDSRESLVRQFVAATQETACDENTVSQLTNGWERITEQLAGGPAPRPRGGSPARNRPRQAGAQDEAEEAPQPATAVVASSSQSHVEQDPELPAYIPIPALGSTVVGSALGFGQWRRLPFSGAPKPSLPPSPAMQCLSPPGLESQTLSAGDWQSMVELDPVLPRPEQAVHQVYKAQKALEQALIALAM